MPLARHQNDPLSTIVNSWASPGAVPILGEAEQRVETSPMQPGWGSSMPISPPVAVRLSAPLLTRIEAVPDPLSSAALEAQTVDLARLIALAKERGDHLLTRSLRLELLIVRHSLARLRQTAVKAVRD